MLPGIAQAVVIATAARDQSVAFGHVEEAGHGVGGVHLVVDFHAYEAGGLEFGAFLVKVGELGRMGQDRDSSNPGQEPDPLFGRHLLTFGVGEAVAAQVFRESVLGLTEIALLHEGEGNVRPANGSTLPRDLLDTFPFNMEAVFGQLFHHHPAALQASPAESGEDALELRVFTVEEVPQHVNFIARDVGTEFDPRYYAHTRVLRGRLAGFIEPRGRVVVGNRNYFETLAGDEIDQLGGPETPVGCGGVQVEVYSSAHA